MAAPSRTGSAPALAGIAAVILAACGGSSKPPSPGTPGGGGGETITGRERIGWTQDALDADQLATFRYAAYVDNVRRVLEGAACAASGGGPFECSSPLPSMTSGPHTLELVSFTVTEEDTILESERSAPLRLTVAAVSPSSVIAANATLTTPEGHRVRATVVAEGLDDPTDLAVAPDGRVFATERAGRVRILGSDQQSTVALELEDVSLSADSGLTSIALDPHFDSNGFVYLAYTSEARDANTIKIARFRERNGILAQGALAFRDRTDTPAHVTIRFGKDAKIYAGVSADRDPRAAQDLSSPLGKILRLNPDGSSPRDNPRASPTLTSGHREPRGFAWHPATSVMWEIERDRDRGDELNAVVAGSDYGWPMTSRGDASIAPALTLPVDTDVAGLSVVPDASRSPLAGELLIASRGAKELIRVAINSKASPVVIGGITQQRYGRLSAVAVAADGTIYAATSNRDLWGPGNDVVIQFSLLTDQRIAR